MDLFYMKHRTYMDVVLLGTVILRFQLHVRNYVKYLKFQFSSKLQRINCLGVIKELWFISVVFNQHNMGR